MQLLYDDAPRCGVCGIATSPQADERNLDDVRQRALYRRSRKVAFEAVPGAEPSRLPCKRRICADCCAAKFVDVLVADHQAY